MSGSVSFNSIPPNLRIPLVAIEFDNSQAGASQPTRDTLLIGQALTSVPPVAMLVSTAAQARALYGRGSSLARMTAAYLLNDNLGRLWCLALPQSAGATAATGGIVLSGTATAAGQLSLYVAGVLVPVAVAVGDTSTVIASNTATAINANPDLPVTAVVSGSTVQVTARQAFQLGNAIDMRLNYLGLPTGEQLPAGLAIGLNVMGGGAGDPDMTGLDALLGDQPFDFVVSAFGGTAAIAGISTLLNNTTGRWAPTRQTYGHGWGARSDSNASAAVAAANLQAFGAALNGPHNTTFGYNNSPTWPCEAAAMFAGTCAPAIRADPARPVQTLQVQGFCAPPPASRLTKLQQQVLLTSGIATLSYDAAGNTYIQRAVTNYQTNAYGQPDNSYLDAETLYTLEAVSQQLSAALSSKFGRSKLADDGTAFGPGQPVVTPLIVKAEIIAQYVAMETAGLVEDAAAMAASTQVVRNQTDPSRLDVLWVPYLIGGLRVVAIKNQFHLLSALAA